MRTKIDVTAAMKSEQKSEQSGKKPAEKSTTQPKVEQSQSLKVNLADELASTLKENDRLEYYKKLVRIYPRHLIIKALEECQKVPDERILKNRAALFKSLLNRYAKDTT